jgi:riboflavin synthase
VGEVAATQDDGFARRIRIAPPAELLPLIVERGSIAVDGVSLTVSGLDGPGESPACFEISLIPETLERTTLGERKPGDRVNLECDVVARYVQRLNTPLPPSERENQ